MKKRLGLDLGVASVGWCLMGIDDDGNPLRIIDANPLVFDSIEDGKTGTTENQNRRIKRGMRRQRRRRVLRLEDLRKLFADYFHKDFFSSMNNVEKGTTPFDLKVKGLKEKLTEDELMVVLYHYLKYRGFKSNRKVDDLSNPDNKKMLGHIASVRKEMELKGLSITEYLKQSFDEKNPIDRRYHNSSSDFLLTVSRDMYRDEISKLLKKQLEYKTIKDDFADKFFAIYDRQRDFSEGPDSSSEYHVDFNKIIGICSFDGVKRAPKESFSAKSFVLLSALNNLSYKLDVADKEYTSLSSDEITKIYNYEVEKMTPLKYSQIFKLINKVPFKIKGVELSKKEYINAINKFKAEKGIVGKSLDEKQMAEFKEHLKKVTNEKKFFSGFDYCHNLKKAVGDSFEITPELYDKASEIVLRYKTDAMIEEKCKEAGFDSALTKGIVEIGGSEKTIDLSLPICQKIIPYLLQGLTYDKALKKLGFDHSKMSRAKVQGSMPDIDQALLQMDLNLTNPVVKHTLINMRRVIMGLIDKYGPIDEYSIELARELKKSFEERKKIRDEQLDNYANNILTKERILETYPSLFPSVSKIRSEDVVKYRLFIEQKGISPYSGKQIVESELFNDNMYQVDHILPYSRTLDDSYSNKVLVETEQNQLKGNRTPFEYFGKKGMSVIYDFLNKTPISDRKSDNLLNSDLTSDFSAGDLSDTSYITTLAKQLITYWMLPEGKECMTLSGSITDKLKLVWGLKNRTHSFLTQDKDYKNRLKYRFKKLTYENDEKGNFESFDFTFTLERINSDKEFKISIAHQKNPEKKLSQKDIMNNKVIDVVYANRSLFESHLKENSTVVELIDSFASMEGSVNLEEFKDNALRLLGKLSSLIDNEQSTKDRSNDLHHALDAAVIAAVNPTLVKRITEYYKNVKETNDCMVVDGNLVNEKTGEIVEPALANKEKLPLPYKDFSREVLLRVYEKDPAILTEELNKLSIYHGTLKPNDVKPMYPTRIPVKEVKGAISSETIFGFRNNSLTKRVSVTKMQEKDLNSIIDYGSGNGAVKKAIADWMANGRPTSYPILPSKGVAIKKVRVTLPSNFQAMANLSNNRFAGIDSVVRVNVYRKKNDDGILYFSPLNYYQISREQIYNKQKEKLEAHKINAITVSEPNYAIMDKQGNDFDMYSKTQLDENFSLVASLPKYSLIEVEMKNGKKSLCYSGGLSNGLFEVYSIIGDGSDLFLKENSIFAERGESSNGRNQLTVSTIKNIVVHNISVTGKIS
jgi:CRISPR subtype II RNA-guided endonuclease Cas9/Csn1